MEPRLKTEKRPFNGQDNPSKLAPG